jgi:hypothetical protein
MTFSRRQTRLVMKLLIHEGANGQESSNGKLAQVLLFDYNNLAA